MRTTMVALLGLLAGCAAHDNDVWSADVTQLVVRYSDGFVQAQPTADCPTSLDQFKLVVGSKSLVGFTCTPDSVAPYPLVRRSVSRVLSDAELDGLVAKLEMLHVVHESTCGADKPSIDIEVTKASKTIQYGDSFYSCNGDDRPKLDTHELDVVVGAFLQLGFPTP